MIRNIFIVCCVVLSSCSKSTEAIYTGKHNTFMYRNINVKYPKFWYQKYKITKYVQNSYVKKKYLKYNPDNRKTGLVNLFFQVVKKLNCTTFYELFYY